MWTAPLSCNGDLVFCILSVMCDVCKWSWFSILNLKYYVCMSSTDLTAVVAQKLKSANIYVLGGLVKMFFRCLPDPLFTEALYPRFAEGIGTWHSLHNFILSYVHSNAFSALTLLVGCLTWVVPDKGPLNMCNVVMCILMVVSRH